MTPFLLSYLVEHTEGASLEANLAAVRGNVDLAGRIAAAYAGRLMTGRLLVVGDVVTDIVAVPAAPPAPDTDTTAAIRTPTRRFRREHRGMGGSQRREGPHARQGRGR